MPKIVSYCLHFLNRLGKNNKKSILITGVAGSGKSTVVKALSLNGREAYDLELMEGMFSAVNKDTNEPLTSFDNTDLSAVKKMAWICNINKLKDVIASQKKQHAYYCANASNIDELIPLFYRCIYLTVPANTLEKRLESRTGQEFGRTKEIRERVLSRKAKFEEHMKTLGATEINGDQDIEAIMKNIEAIARTP